MRYETSTKVMVVGRTLILIVRALCHGRVGPDKCTRQIFRMTQTSKSSSGSGATQVLVSWPSSPTAK
jgi:hypothetical protein